MPDAAPRYRDPSLSVDDRVDDLLARMTLDEKLAQIGSYWAYQVVEGGAFSAEKARALMPDGVGQITRVGGSSNLLPEDATRLGNGIQRYLVEETRLGIPALVHEECCSGYMARGATVYPQALGIAASWRPDLAERMATEIRRQIRVAGGHQALAPVLDVTRDPRWGRTEETFGEDHHLVADFGVAYVRGLQGDGFEADGFQGDGAGGGGVVATAKHFVGYGLTEGGMNWAPAHIAPRELRETFVHPFEAAIREAGLGSVMNAYHEVDGMPCGADEALLTDLLRGELGFEGVVVSDYFAVNELKKHHRLAKTKGEAAALALTAGIDVELPAVDCYGDPLREAIESGAVDVALVDRAVRRGLAMKVRLGLFERPYADEGRVAAVFADPAPRETAREIAEASFVLLKNEGESLPLAPSQRIAVIGPNADSARNLYGDYAYPAHIDALFDQNALGADQARLPDGFEKLDYLAGVPSVLDAVREAAGGAEVAYAEGCGVKGDDRSGFEAAVEAARGADVAVVVVGGRSGLTDDCTCGEARDRATITLPGVQEDLVRAVAATGTPVALVVVGGRPYALTGVVDHVASVLHCWLPGEAGGAAVARTLFGDAVPGGKLPITVPRAVGQVPVFYNHRPSGGHSHWLGDYADLPSSPLFPFGFGLSYTTFRVSDLSLDADTVDSGGALAVRVRVENTGDRDGTETVQVYARHEAAGLTRPVRQLVGYARVAVPAGGAEAVSVEVPARRFGLVDRDLRFVIEPGPVRLMVGTSSASTPLEATVEVGGAGPNGLARKAVSADGVGAAP
jgi:beta-glucosidase